MAIMKKPYTDVIEVEKYFEALYGEVTDFQKDRYLKAFNNFKNVFGYDGAYVASSSGRVEVCGNHTDHNGGKVLSCAISLDTLAMFMPTDNGVIKIKSEGYSDIEIDLNGTENEKIGTSAALVRGVAVATKNKGFKVGGFNATFTSNVIGGAGISSSASFEVLVAEILYFLYNDGKMTAEEKAVIAQYSENVAAQIGDIGPSVNPTTCAPRALAKLIASSVRVEYRGKLMPKSRSLSLMRLICSNTSPLASETMRTLSKLKLR